MIIKDLYCTLCDDDMIHVMFCILVRYLMV